VPSWIRALISVLLACGLRAGPVEFGLSEFEAAVKAKKLLLKVNTNLSVDAPETFRIEPYQAGGARVSGGDLRGLMYGLLEAAAQVRANGRLSAAHGVPANRLRAVRIVLDAADLSRQWFASDVFWREYFQMLAEARVNHLDLVVPRWEAMAAIAKRLAPLAAEYAVDFTIGLPPLSSDAEQIRASLASAVTATPLLRGFEMDTPDAPIELLRVAVLDPIKLAGRRVTLDVHDAAVRPDLARAAIHAGVPLRVSSADPCDDHLHLEEGFCSSGTGYEYYLQLRGAQSGDAAVIRTILAPLEMLGAIGFEVDAPGSHPGGDADTVGWSFEKDRDFYQAWGRIGYDPKPPVQAAIAQPANPRSVPFSAKPSAPPAAAASKPASPAKPAAIPSPARK
jgi:hypothetical protein